MKESNRFLHLVVVSLVLSWGTPVYAMESIEPGATLQHSQPRKKNHFKLMLEAAIHDQDEELQQLLDTSPKRLIKKADQVFQIALSHNSLKVAKMLLNRGVRPETCPVHFAVGWEFIDMLKLLLQYDFDLDKRDFVSSREVPTPLLVAVEENMPICARLLVAAGADTTVPLKGMKPGRTALHQAVSTGHDECMQIVLCTPTWSMLRNVKTLLLVFKRFQNDPNYGFQMPKDIQHVICKLYLTPLQLDKANKLCGLKDGYKETAYDLVEDIESNSVVAQLTNPADSIARRKLIWDSLGVLMAGNTQQEETEHESER